MNDIPMPPLSGPLKKRPCCWSLALNQMMIFRRGQRCPFRPRLSVSEFRLILAAVPCEQHTNFWPTTALSPLGEKQRSRQGSCSQGSKSLYESRWSSVLFAPLFRPSTVSSIPRKFNTACQWDLPASWGKIELTWSPIAFKPDLLVLCVMSHKRKLGKLVCLDKQASWCICGLQEPTWKVYHMKHHASWTYICSYMLPINIDIALSWCGHCSWQVINKQIFRRIVLLDFKQICIYICVCE